MHIMAGVLGVMVPKATAWLSLMVAETGGPFGAHYW